MITKDQLSESELIVLAHLRGDCHNSELCRMCQLYQFGVKYGQSLNKVIDTVTS